MDLLTRGKIRRATIKDPKGIKKSECVNCLWYSRDKIGSVDDWIRTSKSGVNPARNPIKPILKILFLLAADCAKAAPTVPWDSGSMLI